MDIGPYRVLRKLGAGGMGEVFLAEDTRLQRRVALKALHLDAENHSAKLLLREARAAARLNHPNIAAVHDVIDSDGRAFIVMEYVEGEPLSAAVGRSLPIARAVDIGIQLADAVAFVHAQGVVHRDIKPGNVMVTPGGHVKLLDLGLARVTEAAPDGAAAPGSTASLSGVHLAGTPAYMAPEQLLGGAANGATDIYSLGVLMFELLTGRKPFEGRDLVSLATAISSHRAPRLSDVRSDVPASLSDLIARTLSKDQRERPVSAAQFGAELAAVRRELASGSTIGGTLPAGSGGPERATPRRRGVLPVVIAAGLAAAVFGLLGWLFVDGRSTRPGAAQGPIGVLPAVNASGDPELDELGAGMMSVITGNLEAAPGLTVIAPGSFRAYRREDRDLEKAAREFGALYLIDVSLQKAAGGVAAGARVFRAGTREALWTGRISGDLLAVHRGLMDGIAGALERAGAPAEPLDADARRRIRAVPTENAEALQAYAQARVLLASVDSEEKVARALQLFEKSAALDPQFALAHAGMSEAAAAMYRRTRPLDPVWLARAAESARRAMELEPRSGQVQYALAQVLRVTGRPADAARHLELAVRLSPDSDDVHRLTGMVLRDQGKLAESESSMQRAIELRPGYWLNHYHLGLTYIEAHRYKDAVMAFGRVTELRPDYPGGFQALGTAHHYAGELDLAMGHYGTAIRIGEATDAGASADAYANLGHAFYGTGRFEEALEMYRKAAELEPDSAPVHRNLGDVLTRLRRPAEARRAYEDAIAHARRLLAVNALDASAVGLIAFCEARLGRSPTADLLAAEALTLAPDSSDSAYEAAAVYALTGQTDKAFTQLERALALGYPRQLAKDDGYFETLSNDPRFKRLLAGTHP